MNQILAIENKKKKEKKKKNTSTSNLEIKGIVMFFAIAMMVFGIVLAGEGSYSFYRKIDDKKPENIPTVTIGRVNDQAIIRVEHNTEIAKIAYSWDNGSINSIPIGALTAQEKITLPITNSTLNLTIEDNKGKQVNYQKQFILEGVDVTPPTIQIDAEDGKNTATIIATDEIAISYLSYQWEDEEEPTYVDYETEGQKEIKVEIPLTTGSRKLKIVAEDMNGNVKQETKTMITSTSKPEMRVLLNKNEIYIEATDKDGIKDIVVNVNGKIIQAKDINKKELKAGPVYLQEGNNTISVEVTNINGVTVRKTAETEYNPITQ